MIGLGIFAATFAVYGLVAVRAERLGISRALVFVCAGAAVTLLGLAQPLPGERPALLLLRVSEIALALVLFAEASRVSFVHLRHGAGLTLRLIGPGMLFSIGLGTLVGLCLFGDLDWWECAILASILAPTDIALSAAVVENPVVPERVRHALTVEAGINDGVAVPLLLLFIAGATVTEGLRPGSFWATTTFEKVGIGVLAGVVVGVIAGELVRRAREAGSSSPASERLAMAGVGLALFIFTQEVGGSGFVAAFAGGLAAGSRLRDVRGPALGFTDEEGALLTTFVFFALGLTGAELLDQVTWRECVYAALSLTVVRMSAVGLALVGSGLRAPTVAFIGWFGPRGLASVVLALVVLAEDHELTGIDQLVRTVLVTVVASVVLHGVSAAPLSRRYGAWAATLPTTAREIGRAPDVPVPPTIGSPPNPTS